MVATAAETYGPNGGNRVPTVVEVPGTSQMMYVLDNEIKFVDETPSIIKTVTQTTFSGDVISIAIHPTKNIFSMTTGDANFKFGVYSLGELCSDACGGTCTGRTASDCVTCATGYNDLGGTCVEAGCNPGEYKDGTCLPCDSSCGSGCTAGGNTNCLDCDSGFEDLGGACVAVCDASEFRNGSGVCESCPSCCTTCGLVAGDLSCGVVKAGFIYEAGVCEENSTDDTSGDETNVDDTGADEGDKKKIIDFRFSRIGKLSFKIFFDSSVLEFEKEKNLKIEIDNMKEDTDFTFELTELELSIYKIVININKEYFQEELTLKVENVQNSENNLYKDKYFKASLSWLGIKTALGMSEPTEEKIKMTTKTYSNYGQLTTLIRPEISSLLIPMNCFKTLALLPFKLPTKFLKFLDLFVIFQESDPLAKKIYSPPKEEIQKKTFQPKNQDFAFSSIYHQTTCINSGLRILSFFLFLMFRSGIEKIREDEKSQKINCFIKYFYIYLVKLIVSITYINLPSTLIYFCTSLQNDISFLEFGVLAIDLLVISFFLAKIRFYVRGAHHLNKKKLNSYLKLSLMNTTMAYQNGELLAESMHGLVNFFTMTKILIVFLLQDYPMICGASLILLSFVSIKMVFDNLDDKSYFKSTRLLAFNMTIESILFIIISLVSFIENLRNNEAFNWIIIILSLVWVLLSIILSIILIFEKSRFDRKKKEKVEPKNTSFEFTPEVANINDRKREGKKSSFKVASKESLKSREGNLGNKVVL